MCRIINVVILRDAGKSLQLAKGKWNRREGYVSGRKVPVLGLIQRNGGKVVVKVIPNRNKKTVEAVIFKHVEVESKIFTDGHLCYSNLSSYFRHEWVNHRGGEYVRGNVHTNTIENFWSQVKKCILGTHAQVSIEHLQRYCDEVAYRFNSRGMTSLEKFNELLKRACSTSLREAEIKSKTKCKKNVRKKIH